MKPRPIVGQTLYALNVGNNARHIAQILRPVRVISVGRKYFKALPEEYARHPDLAVEYHLKDWKEVSQYSASWALYQSVQEREEEKESHCLANDIRALFSGYGKPAVTLAALRIAHKALINTKETT